MTADPQLEEWIAYVETLVQRRLHEAPSEAPEDVIDSVLDRVASQALATHGRVALPPEDEAVVRHRVRATVSGLGPLQGLLDDEDIENINLTGTRVWVRYADGRREERPPIVSSGGELVALVRRLATNSDAGERRFDTAAPLLNVSLADGSRLHAVMGVAHEVAVSIRRHRYSRVSLEELATLGTLEPVVVGLLRAAVRSRRNTIITGATAAGKTTLLRAMAAEIPHTERIITIEDTPELRLERERELHPDCVALHARPPNVEGEGAITMSELVRESLRMSPDRVIVGESRGEETLALLKAMSQGTRGSLTTLHADSSADAFARLCAYAVDAPRPVQREQMAMLYGAAVDLVVHIDATPAGERVVTSVREIVGTDGDLVASNEIYRRHATDGRVLPAAPPNPGTVEALQRGGFDTTRLGATGVGEWVS